MPLSHHELCFGCGRANLFGLQMELERREDGSVAGRCFLKQDHQGPPGQAHGGIVGAALDEAMALAAGDGASPALTARFEVALRAPAPVGAFLDLEARVERTEGNRSWARAAAYAEGELVAEASAELVITE